MTNDMKNISDNIRKELEEECLYCLEKMKQCNKAIVKLPYTNEDGINVVWGAILEINNIRDYYYNRIQLASSFVSEEFIEKHRLYDKNIK